MSDEQLGRPHCPSTGSRVWSSPFPSPEASADDVDDDEDDASSSSDDEMTTSQ